MNTNIFWDAETKNIKGSFVNLALTTIIALIIFYAILFGSKQMIQDLKDLQNLITWFFGLSFGIWSGKTTISSVFSPTSTTTTATTTTPKES